MADDDNHSASGDQTDQSPSGAGSEAPDPAKVIEDLRKRQSGADKARDEAIRERDEALARLAALSTGKKPEDGAATPDAEAIRAEVQKEYEAKLLAATLDVKYPEARKRFPEVTDTAKLAELETLFAEAPTPPKPIGNNAPRGNEGDKRIEDMSVAELRKELDRQAAAALKRE